MLNRHQIVSIFEGVTPHSFVIRVSHEAIQTSYRYMKAPIDRTVIAKWHIAFLVILAMKRLKAS